MLSNGATGFASSDQFCENLDSNMIGALVAVLHANIQYVAIWNLSQCTCNHEADQQLVVSPMDNQIPRDAPSVIDNVSGTGREISVSAMQDDTQNQQVNLKQKLAEIGVILDVWINEIDRTGATALIALLYMDRWARNSRQCITPDNSCGLLLASLMLANKYWLDSCVEIPDIAKILGVTNLKEIEASFLHDLSFDASFQIEDYVILSEMVVDCVRNQTFPRTFEDFKSHLLGHQCVVGSVGGCCPFFSTQASEHQINY